MNNLKLDIEKIVDLYKSKFDVLEHNHDDYINLILFYWNISFDYGLESYCITNDIFSKKEILDFPQKVEQLFHNISQEYPDSKELLFWKMYIEELNSFSTCLYKKEILELLEHDQFLLPYFYLKVQCETLNLEKVKELKIKLLKENDSYKKYYVLPYLDDISI